MNLNNYRDRVEHALERALPHDESLLTKAMRYSTLNAGKRLRAALIYAVAEDFSLPLSLVDNAACALECIHAYSLIHDDLPAMDNDDLRRGKASCHKAFDEATAILAGDALNTLAFALLARDEKNGLAQIRCLSAAAGAMVCGQSLDMIYTGTAIDVQKLQIIHQQKTGALLTAALHLGALPSPDYAHYQTQLTAIGKHIGIAYQIIDDMLDATSDSQTLGKTAGKDAQQLKNTYMNFFSPANIQSLIAHHEQCTRQQLNALPNCGQQLSAVIDLIFHRQQ